jgi:hypothetical protein
MSAFKNAQHRVITSKRTFHFVAYESVPPNERRGEVGAPSMWYLMGPAKRWPVMPHVDGLTEGQLDVALRQWLDVQGLANQRT